MSILETFTRRTRDNLFFGNITSARFIVNPNNESHISNIAANNPNLNSPSVAGLRFFGQNPIAILSQDQIFPKPVAQYPSNIHGAGMTNFRFVKDPLFAGNNPIAYSFGVLSLGSQFVNIPGANTLISGGMQSILSSSIKSLIQNLLPSNIPSFPFQSSIFSLLDNTAFFNKDLINSLNSLITASAGALSSGPNSSFIPTLYKIGNLLTSTILNKSMSEISNNISQFVQSLNSYKSGIISPGLSNLINENSTDYLNGIIDEKIHETIPGGSPIIRSLFSSTSNLSNIMNTNIYQSVNLANNTDAAFSLISKSSAIFAGSTTPTVSNDEIYKGSVASNEVLEILKKIKNDVYDNRISNVWDNTVNEESNYSRSYVSNGSINIQK